MCDFKEQLPRPSRLQEPLVAFANQRGGVVAIGISKTQPHRVIGTDWSQEHEEKVQEMARATQPPIHLDVSTSWVDGHQVAFLQIEPVEQGWIQTSDGRLLIRSGPTNRALVGAELLRFVRERATDPVEDELIRGLTDKDLNEDLVQQYLGRRLPLHRDGLGNALRDLGFATDKGELRMAAALLFGKNPQRDNRRFGIEVLRFEGVTSEKPPLRDKQELGGPLPHLVAEVDNLIYREMRRDAVVRGLVREEVPEFPPVVVREALLNAIGHRDYSARGASTQVRIYDDVLEIESPGTLPGYVTVETLRDEQYSRNQKLMDGLQRLGLVEEAGQGIDRMYSEMEDALLEPPQFEERSSSFLVRLKGTSVFAAEDRLWVGRFSDLNLSASEKVALVYTKRHGAIRNEELRNLRNLDRDSSRVLLQGLVARGLLDAVGRGRGARYVLGQAAQHGQADGELPERQLVVMKHARRQGSIVNADVRGLLDVDRFEAREILYGLVGEGLLRPEGERRGRRYLPGNEHR